MRTLKDKRFRYGTFSTVMMLLAAVMFVLINLLAGEFNHTRDLTSEQIYSLTEQSRDFLAGIEQGVTITLLARAGQEHPQVPAISRITKQLLEEYAAASSRLQIETRDPLLNPALVHRFAAEVNIEDGIPEHSVVVQSGTEIRVIQPHEMIDFEFNHFTGANRVTGFNVEREITRAIHHVTQGTAAIVYVVTGSGEQPLHPQFIAFLEGENFDVREVNLVLEDVPEETDILFITMPARDWTETKAKRLFAFLATEGRAFFALDYVHDPTPNLANVLDAYGLSLGENLVFEDAQNIFMGRTIYIVPNIVAHEITENLHVRNFMNLIPVFPVEMQLNDVRRTTLNIEPLWVTSRDAFSRGLDSTAETKTRVPSDIPGPFPLALAVTDRLFIDGTAYYTQFVAVSSMGFIDPWYLAYIGEGNWHFVLNSLRWMQNQPPAIWVPGRMPPGQMPLLITEGATNVIGGVAMGGIPLVCIAVGVFFWFKRRHS